MSRFSGCLGVFLFFTGLCWIQQAQAVITRLTPLREVLNSEQLIFVAKVEKIDPDKPSVVFTVSDQLKGKAPFQRMPVNLTADSEGQREGHTAKLLKRLAQDLEIIVFTSKRGKKYTAFGYTNGTWFQMKGEEGDGSETVRWSLNHCEPYLRRTFKGTTAELKQVTIDGLAKKKAPPEPDMKEPPGLGPEVEADKAKKTEQDKTKTAASGGTTWTSPTGGPLFAVIPTFVILGPLAVLAALFPALFGGLALLMRRWIVLLSIASLNSTILLAHSWFSASLQGTWWGTRSGLWATLAAVSFVGLLWSWKRNRSIAQVTPVIAAAPPQRRW